MDIYDLIMEKMNKKEELDDKDFRQLIDSDTPYEIEDYKYLVSEILNNYHISDFMADELIFKLRQVIGAGNYRFENEDKDTFFLNQVLNLYYDYIKPDPKDAGVLYRLARRAYNKDEFNELSSQTYLNFVGIIFDMCNFEYNEDISDVLFCAKSKILELQYANDENAEEFKAKYREWITQILQNRCRSLGGAILDGLAVCSGDAFGLKNLLAMRGIKAYVTHGEIKSLNDDGHAWNTIRLGGNYYKFDGTVEREDTLKNGTLSLQAVKKEHGINDDYNNMFAVRQSYEAIYDEQSSKQGKRKDSLAQEFD